MSHEQVAIFEKIKVAFDRYRGLAEKYERMESAYEQEMLTLVRDAITASSRKAKEETSL